MSVRNARQHKANLITEQNENCRIAGLTPRFQPLLCVLWSTFDRYLRRSADLGPIHLPSYHVEEPAWKGAARRFEPSARLRGLTLPKQLFRTSNAGFESKAMEWRMPMNRRYVLSIFLLLAFGASYPVAQDEASFEQTTDTAMIVPTELVPVVRELIEKHKRTALTSGERSATAGSGLRFCESVAAAL